MKETKEALVAIVSLGKLVADRLKDGVQLDDALAIAKALTADGEFKAKIDAGVDGLDKIPAEFENFGLAQAFELAQVLPELIEIINPPAPAKA